MNDRVESGRLAEEQLALRRVATLVAQGASPPEVFEAVVTEIGRQVPGANAAALSRYETDDTLTMIGKWGQSGGYVSVGARYPLATGTVGSLIAESGRPARVDVDEEGLRALPEVIRNLGWLSVVGAPIIVDGRLWGLIGISSTTEQSLPSDTEGRLAEFTELVATAIANAESREALALLAEEQAALRRVATLVATEASQAEVFALIAEEMGRLIGAQAIRILRYEGETDAIVVASWGVDGDVFPQVGFRAKLGGDNATTRVFVTGQAVRIDDYADASGPIGEAVKAVSPLRSSVATPILVEGRTWGVVIAGTSGSEPMPPGTESRLTQFSDLVATAISNADSREGLSRLAQEQAALRRVATIAARESSAAEVLEAVAGEAARVLEVDAIALLRFEPDESATLVAQSETPWDPPPLGTRFTLEGENIIASVHRTGQAARMDDWETATGSVAAMASVLGVRSTVASPIVVEGQLWGTMVAATNQSKPLPADTESRIVEFTELLATSIANAESRHALSVLADEQTALRRVATLVAQDARPSEIFAAVAEEVAQLFQTTGSVLRFDEGGQAAVIVGIANVDIPLGTRLEFEDGMGPIEVYRTGRSVRIDHTSIDHTAWASDEGSVVATAGHLGLVSSVVSPIVVEGRTWGVIGVSSTDDPLPLATEERLEKFTELVATAIANADSREALSQLAMEQAALRRVATLVAQGLAPREVFAIVAEEVAVLFELPWVGVMRYESDASFSVVATWGEHPFATGSRWPLDGPSTFESVLRTGRPARISDYTGLPGTVAEAARNAGIVGGIGAPIIVEGSTWGVIAAPMTADRAIPDGAEIRLNLFTELLATAIANAESRGALFDLADEQAALRRVATLVAGQAVPAVIYAAVAEEVARRLLADRGAVVRYEPDDTLTVVAYWSTDGTDVPIGTRIPLEGDVVTATVRETGRSTRIDSYDELSGPLVDYARTVGPLPPSTVAAPIFVEGEAWGTIFVSTMKADPFPDDAESRVMLFTELVATAIANSENRSELAASRKRLVEASDEARRRIERDLHDGTQQRLVSLALAARAAAADLPTESSDVREKFSSIATGLGEAVEDLQELSRGIHPAILSDAGLGPALETLALRSPIPVELEVRTRERFPEPVEVAAYFVASESLANAAKHSQASRVTVLLAFENEKLGLSVRDDGMGGADPGRGSGLVGLRDRVEALGGTLAIESGSGAGTSLRATLPIGDDRGDPI